MANNGPEFFQTVMGNKFFNSQLPKLIKTLEAHTEALNKNTEMMAKYLEVKDKAALNNDTTK